MNYKKILKLYVLQFIFYSVVLIPLLVSAGIKNSKHDLSVSGIGQVKAFSETGICIFCHTPHNANPSYPLWNHEITAAENYINYWSPSLKAYPSQAAAPPIDGFSRLCLSCHDGTVAVGAVINFKQEDIKMVTIPNIIEASKLRPGAAGYLGTDLSGGHPISFIYDATLVARRNTESDLMHLNWPINDPDVRLYSTQGGKGVQCTSCHNPHGSEGGPNAPPFWQKPTHDEVCLVCHDIT